MKKIMPILAMLIIVPFVLCSCFTKQVESMSLSYEELELHVGDTKHISVTIKPDGADAGTINWSTSDSKIVTVDDGNGYRQGKRNGSCNRRERKRS
ncbi:MAG TPA: Ig-like domain-containing protein [Ruminococcus bromii]|nr:Ig-like domain-containing protein [Ruminococcus bromii]